MSNQKKLISLLLSFIMVLSMVFLLSACGQTTVDVSDYVTVTYDSYNTMGSAKVNIDYTGLNSLVDTETVNEYMNKFPVGQQSIALGYSFNFAELLDIKLKENYSELSNGDKVIVEIGLKTELSSAGETIESIQKALKVKIPATEIEFTVSGLQEAKILDVVSVAADYIEYTGANGGATAEVIFPDDYTVEIGGIIFKKNKNDTSKLNAIFNNQSIGTISFLVPRDYNKNLTNGDIIPFVAFSELLLDRTNYDIAKSRAEITVSGLGEYVTSRDMLTSELKTQIEASLNERFADSKNFTIVDYCWGKLKNTAVTDNPAVDSERLFVYAQYELFGMAFTKRCEATIIRNVDNTYDISWSCMDILSSNELYPEDYDIEIIEF